LIQALWSEHPQKRVRHAIQRLAETGTSLLVLTRFYFCKGTYLFLRKQAQKQVR